MVGVLILLVWSAWSPLVHSYCPTGTITVLSSFSHNPLTGCHCNNDKLSVSCTNSSLSILPITLNPHITSLVIHNTRVSAVSDGLQFYEALHNLDLSHNRISTIQDRAFSYQVG